MGAKVYSSGTRETGWRSVSLASHQFLEGFGDEAIVFHWHGDTFDLPPGATLLASNDAFKNQAFCAKDGRVIATQFHFEATRDSLNDLLDADEEYLEFNSPFVQSVEQIVEGDEYIDETNRLLFELLDRWICVK
jgi:GMP synthase-like glutamine amidotransferase